MANLIKPGDYDSLTTYLNSKIKNNTAHTKQKYLVILHGPPSSGKAHATKVACRLIYEYFEKTVPLSDLKNTFLNTNVDSLTYDTLTMNNISVKQALIDNLYTTIGATYKLDYKNEIDVNLVESNIDKLVKTSYEIYQAYRPDNVSEIMFYLSVFLGLNIFLETSNGDPAYLSRVVESLKFYGYIPIIIYPFVADVSVIYHRSIKRGMMEGRFICKDTIAKSMVKCLDNYHALVEIISKHDQYAYYQYDANYPDCDVFLREVLDINNPNFFRDNLLDIGVKNNINANDKMVGSNIINMKIKNYDQMTQLQIN